MANSAHIPASTVDPAEIERFARIAEEWWDPRGKFAPLHRLNPVRLGFIRDRTAAHWQRDALSDLPLQGLSLIDIGCGGGLICEPMARLGARVTGIDAADRNIATAKLHAAGQDLAIDYRETTAEALADTAARFDIVLALEIVEHVADVDLFLQSVGRLAKPGGLVFLSTLNRTAKAWALAIAGAEYVMRWLPRGTHDWRKFLKPSEVVRGLRLAHVEPQEIVGVVYSPLSREWSLSKRDLDVNYMLYGSKAGG
jgi:2-polyprenyl-6-hydroxyphenyl methylase/3-demethylubiquinone-9 3-methyltransferase